MPRGPARPWKPVGCGCGRNFLADRLGGGADVDAGVALGARDAVDGGAGHQVAIQRNGAAGVVIARHHEGDALGIGIGIDDRGNGNVEPLRFLDRDVFLVGVDHEDHVGKTAHVLDAAERAVELVALALQRQPLLLGVGVGLAGRQHLVEVTQTLDRAGNRLPVGQRAAEPARIDEILRRALGGLGDAVLRLALGADEQDAAALGDGVADTACSARCSIGTVWARSMMWMLLRAPKMNSAIFGFQRCDWWPK